MKKQTNSKKRGSKKKFRGQYDARLKRDEYQADVKEERAGGPNDPSWYAANPQLIKDYASYPFGDPLGNLIPGGTSISDVVPTSVPGIMALYFAPSIGNAVDQNAPINVAARNIYSFVRHVNSGHTNYDAPDLMIYLMAMDSVYTYIEYLKRLARVVMDYSVYNRYYPDAIFAANGVDGASIASNIADFRGFINTMVVKAGSLCVPASMTYSLRHMWMTSGIYTDSATVKAQTYMYVPARYYQFALTTGDTPVGMLQMVYAPGFDGTGLSSTPAKYADLINFGNQLLNKVLAQEDFNIMSGDVLKAFGDGGVVKLAGITENEAILPEYRREVLSQIENATILGNTSFSKNITQNTSIGGGYLTSNNVYTTNIVLPSNYPVAKINQTATALSLVLKNTMTKKILNFHWDSVTPEDVVVATRLTNIPTVTSVGADETAKVISVQGNMHGLSSEIIIFSDVFYYRYVSNSLQLARQHIISQNIVLSNAASGIDEGTLQSLITQGELIAMFDWNPGIVSYATFINAAGNPQVVSGNFILQDLDNYTVVNQENLTNMASMALLSQFSVPQMGAFSQKLS